VRYLSRRVAVDEVVIFPADIPLVQAEDVRAVINALTDGPAAPRVVVVRARDGGTNALALRPPEIIPMRFGVASAEAHLSEVRNAGAAAVELQNERIAFDVDSPDDLAALASLAAGPATSGWLRARAGYVPR
jgi:2-phospho-L-lactate guanylyltransferase